MSLLEEVATFVESSCAELAAGVEVCIDGDGRSIRSAHGNASLEAAVFLDRICRFALQAEPIGHVPAFFCSLRVQRGTELPQLLEKVGGPARIQTLDQRIMSSPVPSEAEEDKSVTSAKQGKVPQKLQPGRNLDSEEEST
jgi:hypothetical protein